MGTKMKGIYKGFKSSFSQIFVVKEPEIEIGGPTDVKHVAHIGWDGATGTAPSWMKEFKTGSDFAASSIGNSGSALSTWSAQDSGKSVRQQTTGSEMYKDTTGQTEVSSIKKKQRRKKPKSTSSPRSNSTSSSTRSSRAAKSKTNFVKGNANPTNIEVA